MKKYSEKRFYKKKRNKKKSIHKKSKNKISRNKKRIKKKRTRRIRYNMSGGAKYADPEHALTDEDYQLDPARKRLVIARFFKDILCADSVLYNLPEELILKIIYFYDKNLIDKKTELRNDMSEYFEYDDIPLLNFQTSPDDGTNLPEREISGEYFTSLLKAGNELKCTTREYLDDSKPKQPDDSKPKKPDRTDENLTQTEKTFTINEISVTRDYISRRPSKRGGKQNKPEKIFKLEIYGTLDEGEAPPPIRGRGASRSQPHVIGETVADEPLMDEIVAMPVPPPRQRETITRGKHKLFEITIQKHNRDSELEVKSKVFRYLIKWGGHITQLEINNHISDYN
jgi:hypothetical protein